MALCPIHGRQKTVQQGYAPEEINGKIPWVSEMVCGHFVDMNGKLIDVRL